MARYKVLEDSFIGNAYVVAGKTIEYDAPEGTTIGDNLEPLDEAPKRGRKPAEDAGE